MVKFESVHMAYGKGADVLRDISFELSPGDFRFLTGPSGAGKTTLLKLLYLAQRPTQGQIKLFGNTLSQTPRQELPHLRRRIGVVFQEFRLIDHLTSFENVALPLRIAGKSLEEYRPDVVELLTWVGLGERIHEKPSALSGGEQQRVAIARAVVAKPDLLLADEPTGNVDPEMSIRLLRLFLELNKMGTTIVFATHDRYLVEAVGAPELHLTAGELDQKNMPPMPPASALGLQDTSDHPGESTL
ncbi:MAG: cell division ATP-binding protein FtsE [Alphaproteobacteria bacterium]|nr:MAG: cell division ATP-binding protein FtsE [Alphaproteobacteria bacterium]